MELFEFLGKIYDGSPYTYQLKNTPKLTMDDPLLSLLGCTTPTNISEAMPSAAIGEGFTSRIIFVYGGKKYKSVRRPKAFDPTLEARIEKRLSHIHYKLAGKFTESDAARELADSLYDRDSKLIDGRFCITSGDGIRIC